MKQRTLGLILLSLLILPACGGDAAESNELGQSEAEIAEEAIAEDRQAYQRSALEYIEALQSQISQLEESGDVDPARVRSLKGETARVHESIRELDNVTAVAYRSLHSEMQHRLYRLEANITRVRLRSIEEPEQLQTHVRQQMAALEEEIEAFAATIHRRGRDPQTPHAIDLGHLRKQYNQLSQRISTVTRDTTSFPQNRSEIAEDMAELIVSVRKAKDLVEYPELSR